MTNKPQYTMTQQTFIKIIDFKKPKEIYQNMKKYGIVKSADDKITFPQYILFLHDNFGDAFVKWKQWVEVYSPEQRDLLVNALKMTRSELRLYRHNKEKLLAERESIIAPENSEKTAVTPTHATISRNATPTDQVVLTNNQQQAQQEEVIRPNNHGMSNTALDAIATRHVRQFATNLHQNKRPRTIQVGDDDDDDDDGEATGGLLAGSTRTINNDAADGNVASLFDEQPIRDNTNDQAAELRKTSRKRSLGEHAESVYQQSDQRAITSITATLKAAAKALDTCYFQDRDPTEPQVTMLVLVLNEIERVGSDGGSRQREGVRAAKPQLIALTRSAIDVKPIMDAFHSSTRPSRDEREKYQFIPLIQDTNNHGTNLTKVVDEFLDEVSTARMHPKETAASHDDILDGIGGHDNPMSQ